MEIDGKFVSAYYNKGNSFYMLRRFEEALQTYDKVLKINDKDISIWNNKGNSLSNLGIKRQA